jgi:hypothetical protein
MANPFRRASRTGKHYELTAKAIERIKRTNFNIKARDEREYENKLVGALESSRLLKPNLITQVNRDQVNTITQTKLFGFSHRPDITIGNDGTAIELKVINNSQSIRDIIGQAICYRFDYRFAILVFVAQDHTSDIVELCSKKSSAESEFLNYISEQYGIFSVVGPKDNGKNITFFS